jgi:NAD(P)-dependent dehydrogenase (short-subunit alcohol dehydrogenase family)
MATVTPAQAREATQDKQAQPSRFQRWLGRVFGLEQPDGLLLHRAPRFVDRVAVITGGNRGLGKAFAEAFAKEGAILVLGSRDTETLTATAKEFEAQGRKVVAVPCDVGKEEDILRLFEEVDRTIGRVDILINNAAVSGPTAPLAELTLKDWEETLRVDLTGQFLCAREAVRRMIPLKRGVILNVGSIFGAKKPYPLRSPYAAAKAGLVAMSQSLAWEVGPLGIRVNTILPGPVEGERIQRVWKARAEARGISLEHMREKMTSMAALKRIPTSEEVTNAGLFLCSDESSGMTGQAINLTSGMEMR